MRDTVRAIIVKALNLEEVAPEDIHDHTNLVTDLDADSIDMLELAMTIEDTLGVKMPDDQPELYATLGTLCAYLEKPA